MHVIRSLKQIVTLLSVVFAINSLVITNAQAQDATTQTETTTETTGTTGTTTSGGTLTVVPAGVDTCTDTNSCLQAIMKNTYATLQSVNNIPVLLHDITLTALSWYAHDDTPAMQTMQSSFTTLGNIFTQNITVQNGMQQQVTADVFNVPLTDLVAQKRGETPKIATLLPNVNELSYSTILGMPPVQGAPASGYNYVKAAGGLTIPHVKPPAIQLGVSWRGNAVDQQNYIGYYYTLMAVQTYDAYILSSLYADNQNFQATGTALSPTQASLVSQASNGDWLSTIATEELGKVLRQILVFQSQSYVLLSDLIQTERQLLTAQVMSNSLLIANNISQEGLLLSRAQSPQQTPR